MLNSIILSYTTFVYFAAFMFYLLAMVMNREILARIGTFASLIGLLAQTVESFSGGGIVQSGCWARALVQSLRIISLFCMDLNVFYI